MTDRPILFSAPMVRALLDGRKTQTRRIFKGIEQTDSGDWHIFGNGGGAFGVKEEFVSRFAPDYVLYDHGDRLWVRESWRAARSLDGTKPRDIPHDADIEHAATARSYAEIGLKGKLRPGMFLPRWASRLTLIVTDVRVQRLQDVSEEDAVAEGISVDPETGGYWGADGQGLDGATRRYLLAASAYGDLWNSLNEKRGYGWLANPWVVALTFTAHQCNIDRMTP